MQLLAQFLCLVVAVRLVARFQTDADALKLLNATDEFLQGPSVAISYKNQQD
jgi:hypothetical protein